MGRKERRHPELDDPVAGAQEEATWSAYTRHVRAGEQRKRISRAREPDEPRGLSVKTIAAISVLGGIALGILFWLIDLLSRLYSHSP